MIISSFGLLGQGSISGQGPLNTIQTADADFGQLIPGRLASLKWSPPAMLSVA